MNKKEIEKKAQEALALVDYTIPVPIIEIAQKKGLEVHEAPLNLDANFDCKSVLVLVSGQWTVLLNIDDHPIRKRFAVAVSLGHFVLNENTIKSRISNFEFGELLMGKEDYSLEEKDARYFALCLLLPKQELLQAWQHDSNLDNLANKFFVSREVIAARLQNLKLLEGVL